MRYSNREKGIKPSELKAKTRARRACGCSNHLIHTYHVLAAQHRPASRVPPHLGNVSHVRSLRSRRNMTTSACSLSPILGGHTDQPTPAADVRSSRSSELRHLIRQGDRRLGQDSIRSVCTAPQLAREVQTHLLRYFPYVSCTTVRCQGATLWLSDAAQQAISHWTSHYNRQGGGGGTGHKRGSPTFELIIPCDPRERPTKFQSS